MLSDAAVKLQEGFARLAGAGDDERLLGMALMALHGALEEHFREQLAREIVAETPSRPGWVELVDLWQKHRGLSPDDRALILRTNSKRNQIAHGDPFYLSRSEVEGYGKFVQDFMGVRARPSRRWSKVEDAVVWDDPGVRPVELPWQVSFWSGLLSPLRSARRPTQPAPAAEMEPVRHRLRGHLGWIAKMVVVAVVAMVSFWFWSSWLVSLGITAVILYLIHRQSWLRAGYVYVAGLVYGYVTAVLGLAMTVAFVAALLWPLSAGFYYLTGGSLAWPRQELAVPTMEPVEGILEEELGEEATPHPTATSSPVLNTIQIQVQGNSNVRAEPSTTSAILAVVIDGELYDVLDVNAEKTWYKIQLESGQEGWIGSSRVIEIAR